MYVVGFAYQNEAAVTLQTETKHFTELHTVSKQARDCIPFRNTSPNCIPFRSSCSIAYRFETPHPIAYRFEAFYRLRDCIPFRTCAYHFDTKRVFAYHFEYNPSRNRLSTINRIGTRILVGFKMEKTINHGRSNGGHNEFTLSLPHRCIRFTRCQIEVTSGGPSQPHVDIIPVAGFGAAIGGGVGAVAAEAKSLTLLCGAANRARGKHQRPRVASLAAAGLRRSSGAHAEQSWVLDGVGWRERAKHPWLAERIAASSKSPPRSTRTTLAARRARRGNCRPVRCTRGASARLEPSCIQLKEFNYS